MTSELPAPSAVNMLAAWVTRATKSRWVMTTGASAGSALGRNWMAGPSGFRAAPSLIAS
jgi:hypothetical protein